MGEGGIILGENDGWRGSSGKWGVWFMGYKQITSGNGGSTVEMGQSSYGEVVT